MPWMSEKEFIRLVDAESEYVKKNISLHAENVQLKDRIKFLTGYDSDVDGLQAENERLKKALEKIKVEAGRLEDYPVPQQICQAVANQALKDQ